jgi:hypothetical protein
MQRHPLQLLSSVFGKALDAQLEGAEMIWCRFETCPSVFHGSSRVASAPFDHRKEEEGGRILGTKLTTSFQERKSPVPLSGAEAFLCCTMMQLCRLLIRGWTSRAKQQRTIGGGSSLNQLAVARAGVRELQ